MSVNIQFRNRGRFLSLPNKAKKEIIASSKGLEKQLANQFLNSIQKGLEKQKLNLIPLSRNTIAHKRQEGNPIPTAPMYGKGRNDPRSYYSLLQVNKRDKSTSVGFQGNKRHHSGMTISKLAIMHAQGKGRALPKRNPISSAYNQFNVKRETAKAFLPVSKNFIKGLFKK